MWVDMQRSQVFAIKKYRAFVKFQSPYLDCFCMSSGTNLLSITIRRLKKHQILLIHIGRWNSHGSVMYKVSEEASQVQEPVVEPHEYQLSMDEEDNKIYASVVG